MKKYLTKSWGNEIYVVEADRETATSVWIDGRRHAKESDSSAYHDSFEAARQALIGRHDAAIRVARDKIHRAESALGTIRKMTEADAKPHNRFI